jgi:ABC-type nitrate/sulfonate/bicarbonate transport system substrate-binding protein
MARMISRPLRVHAVLGALTMAALVLSGCGGDNTASADGKNGGKAKSLGTIKMATSLDPGYAQFVVAVDGGFLKDQGIDASYTQYQDGNSAVDAILSGGADVSGTTELGAVSRLAAGGKLYVAGFGNEYGKLIGLAGKESIQRPEDLVGKKVGYVPASGGAYFFARYLAYHHISADDVKAVPIQAPESIAALQRGDVDAISLWQPWLDDAVKQIKGVHQIAWSGDDNVYMGHVFYYVDQKFVDNPKLAGAFFKGMVKAEKFIESNRDEAVKMVSKAFNLSTEETAALMSTIVYRTEYPKELRSWFEDAAKFMVDTGVIKKAPDFSNFFHPELLGNVYPERSCKDC